MNGETFYLTRNRFYYDATVENKVIHSGENKNFNGWNSLTMQNDSILSGGTSELTARTNIDIKQEFIAKSGSEVHIYPSDVFTDCSTATNVTRIGHFSALIHDETTEDQDQKTIRIKFKYSKNEIRYSAYPNPTRENLFITSQSENAFPINYLLLDGYGRLIANGEIKKDKGKILLQKIEAGIYFIQLYNSKYQNQLKIIIQ